MSGWLKRLFGGGRRERGKGEPHSVLPASLQNLLQERKEQLKGVPALVTGNGRIAHLLARLQSDVTLGRPCHHSTGYPGVTYIRRPLDWNSGAIDFLVVDSPAALGDAGTLAENLSPRAAVLLCGNDVQYPADIALLRRLRENGWRQLPFRDNTGAPPCRLWYRDGNFLGI